MHPQFEAIAGEFQSARSRLDRLVEAIPAAEWATRPAPERWSVGECVAHLNLTALGYRQILTDAISRAEGVGGAPPKRYRMDILGWLLWKSMPPPVRGRTKTIPAFLPEAGRPASELAAEFNALQDETLAFLQQADGLPIDRVKITSPFNAKMKYNLYACFAILAAHQHRHLWQAEQTQPAHLA